MQKSKNTNEYKNMVIAWRVQGKSRQANKLAEAIKAYEKSKITDGKLMEIFLQLNK